MRKNPCAPVSGQFFYEIFETILGNEFEKLLKDATVIHRRIPALKLKIAGTFNKA
jgi:hypothetical protein